MTESEAAIRRQVTRVQNAYPSGGGAWAKTRFEEWVAAVRDLDPDAVTTAVTDLIREWHSDYGRPPMPGHLYERAVSVQRQMHADQVALAHERRVSDTSPAPAWFARFVMGIVIRSMRQRGLDAKCPERTVPYLQIADQYELRPGDICGLPCTSNDQRVRDAYLEAERYGLILDPGPSGPEHFAELPIIGRAACTDDPDAAEIVVRA